MTQLLTDYYDPALEVRVTERSADVTAKEIERLSELAAVARCAMEIPRRLGGDATNEELAQDKRRARRVLHVVYQLLKSWHGQPYEIPLPDNPEIRSRAATIVWNDWWEEHRAWVNTRAKYVVTLGRKTGSDERWMKSAVVKYSNELRWIEYALRD